MPTVGDDIGLVLDDPLDDLSLFELHGLSYGSREIDVVLISGLLSLNELDFGRVSHGWPPIEI